jgi:hypothetical protein
MEGSGPDEFCDAFHVSLPDVDASRTLQDGVGPRFSAAGGSAVDCRVRIADPQTPGSFDLELRLGDRMMPRFELRGRVVRSEVATLALAVSLTEVGEMQSMCSGEARTVLPGAVWFPTFSCEGTRHNGAPIDCRFEGGALFERCMR